LGVLIGFGLGLDIVFTLALRGFGLACCYVSLASTYYVLGLLKLTALGLLRSSSLGLLGLGLLDLSFH
jgi:hypothetical protein